MTLSRLLACLAVVSVLFPVCAFSQAPIKVATPRSTPLPGAFSRLGSSEVHFRMAHDNAYAIAYTMKEAKVWKMPEGILVYRYQMQSNLNSVAWNVIEDVTITADGKYVYTSGKSWNEAIMGAAELESGELLQDGLLMDSLRSGAYQMVRGARKADEMEWDLRLRLFQDGSPLTAQRDYGRDGIIASERPTMLAMVPDKTNPGSVIFLTSQRYCRGGRWKKQANEKLDREYMMVSSKKVKNTFCNNHDYHVVRYNPKTRTAEYIGQPIRGVADLDFNAVSEFYPSPFGDVVALEYRGDDSICINTVRGDRLWKSPPGEKWRFDSFDEAGNVVVRITSPSGAKIISVRKPLTGTLIKEFQLPSSDSKIHIIDAWGMIADIRLTSGNYFTMGIYSIEDGRMMLALTDDAGAKAFSLAHKSEADAIRKQNEANRIANERAWANWQESSKRAMLVANAEEEKKMAANAAAAEERSKYYKQCPACGGRGGEYVADYYTTKSSTLLTEDRHYRTFQVTTTKNYSPYKKFQQCPKCWGKGEVRK